VIGIVPNSLNIVKLLFLNVNFYISRYGKGDYEFPIKRIPGLFMSVWTWDSCTLWIPIFVRNKISCSTL